MALHCESWYSGDMEILDIASPDESRLVLTRPPRTGRLHVHTWDEGPMHCVMLTDAEERRLIEALGGVAPTIERRVGDYVASGPAVTLRLGEGETLREVIWDGIAPTNETLELAVTLLDDRYESDDERPPADGPGLYSEIVAGISQALKAVDGANAGVPLATRVVGLVERNKTLTASLDASAKAALDARKALDASEADMSRLRTRLAASEVAEEGVRVKLDTARAALQEISAQITAHGGADDFTVKILKAALVAHESTDPDA